MKKSITYLSFLLVAIFAVFFTAGTAHAQMMRNYESNGVYGPMMEGWAYSNGTSSESYATGTEASKTFPEVQYYNNIRRWSAPDGNYYGYMPMMGYYGYGPMMGYEYGGGWWGWIIPIFIWIVVALGIVAVIRFFRHGHRRWHDYERGHFALDILKERYAKGEIDKKEFEEKKKDLES